MLMTLRLSSTLSWLPLAAIAVLLCTSVLLGRTLMPFADAATVVPVTGSIANDIFLDGTGCTAAAMVIGDVVPGTDPWKTAQDQGGQTCSIDFGTTNYAPGTTLSMLEDPGAPASPANAMKCAAGGCTGSSLGDYDNPAAEPAAGTSSFGAQLVSSGGIAAAVWNPAPGVYDVQDTASPACSTPAVGTGTCAFTWGATASTGVLSGTYQAQAQLVVLAN